MDSTMLSTFVFTHISGLFTTCLTFILAITIMFALDYRLTLILSGIFPIYICIYLKYKKPLYDIDYKQTEEANEFYGYVNWQISNIKLIKQNALSDRVGSDLKKGFKALLTTIMENAKLSYVFHNADVLVRYMANIVIFIYSGYQIMIGNMTIGQFTMMNSYSLMLISSLSFLLGYGRNYRRAMVSYNRIMEIYETPQELYGEICIDHISEVSIKNLNFYYDERHIISDLNLEMEKGKIYAIVGISGSGKSTFLDILSGFIQDYTGNINYNSINLRDLNITHLREKVMAIVEQEPTLYFNTIRDNIYLGNDREQQIEYWLNKLELHDFIALLPNGIESNIAVKTSNLSGGEKQRISLTRAFVKNADLLILDEPTSALDGHSVHNLIKALQNEKTSKIIVVVTHKKELIDICDKVVYLK